MDDEEKQLMEKWHCPTQTTQEKTLVEICKKLVRDRLDRKNKRKKFQLSFLKAIIPVLLFLSDCLHSFFPSNVLFPIFILLQLFHVFQLDISLIELFWLYWVKYIRFHNTRSQYKHSEIELAIKTHKFHQNIHTDLTMDNLKKLIHKITLANEKNTRKLWT